ncbi:MAG: hypothetical protein OEX08_00470 [Candidatus Nomurabacteria bacterium]|nr:hypothetical protein [Candidatus Nomurabacteria bacterium]
MTWIEKSVPSIGLLIGMVLTAIGAVMFLSSIIKIAVYNPTIQTYVSNSCEYDFAKPVIEPGERTPRTPEEIEQCVADRQSEEQARYISNRKDNAIDGGVLLFVGIIFWAIFRQWWKKLLK